MFLRIQHLTRFTYSRAVFIEPMTVRLRPRSDCWQTLHRFNMELDPSPSGITETLDLEGTSSSNLWFNETCSSLNITTTSCVETLRDNPLDYILADPEFMEVPVRFADHSRIALDPYLQRSVPSGQVDRFAEEVAGEVNRNTGFFLSTLCSRIHDTMKITLRPTGDPLSPEELLAQKKGACRDLTVLFMDACRSLGLPARFTSGYYYGDEEFSNRELHAWTEVYLPGGGWRGYDPSIGLLVSDRHVAIASAPTPKLTAPTTGSYRGTGVDSTLDFTIQMDAAESLDELLRTKSLGQK